MERLLTTVLPHCKILREFLFSAMLLETKLDFFIFQVSIWFCGQTMRDVR